MLFVYYRSSSVAQADRQGEEALPVEWRSFIIGLVDRNLDRSTNTLLNAESRKRHLLAAALIAEDLTARAAVMLAREHAELGAAAAVL